MLQNFQPHSRIRNKHSAATTSLTLYPCAPSLIRTCLSLFPRSLLLLSLPPEKALGDKCAPRACARSLLLSLTHSLTLSVLPGRSSREQHHTRAHAVHTHCYTIYTSVVCFIIIKCTPRAKRDARATDKAVSRRLFRTK